MKRRQFITLIGGAAAARPLAARAQQTSSKIPVVGVLWHAGSAEEEDVYLSVLVKAFNDLGYIEGKNIVPEHRFPAENPERFRTLARDLVDAKPDAIIAVLALATLAACLGRSRKRNNDCSKHRIPARSNADFLTCSQMH